MDNTQYNIGQGSNTQAIRLPWVVIPKQRSHPAPKLPNTLRCEFRSGMFDTIPYYRDIYFSNDNDKTNCYCERKMYKSYLAYLPSCYVAVYVSHQFLKIEDVRLFM